MFIYLSNVQISNMLLSSPSVHMEHQIKYSYNMLKTSDSTSDVQPDNVDLQVGLIYPENIHQLTASTNNEFSNVPLVSVPEEIPSFYFEEQMIVPDELPLIGFHEETEPILRTPKIKVKSLEELQTSQSYRNNEQNEYYKIPEVVNNFSLHHITAQKIGSTVNNNIPSNADEVLHAEHIYLEPSVKLSKILKLQKKERLLKERLKKVKEKESLMGIAPKRNNKHNNNKGLEKQDTIHFVDVNNDPTLTQWGPEGVISCEKLEAPISKTSNEFDVTGLKSGVIEASRTLVATQKSLQTLRQKVSSDVYLKDKQAIMLLNQLKDILRTFHKRFDSIKKTVRNQYKDLLPECNIDDLSKAVGESMPTVSSKDNKLENNTSSFDISKPEFKSCEKDHLFLSMTNKCVKPKVRLIQNYNRYGYDKSSRIDRPLKERRDMEVKSSRVGRSPRVRGNLGEGKHSRIGRPPKVKENLEEDKYDKTFYLPGLSQKVNTALRREVPVRSCKQFKSYNFDDEELESVCS